MTAGRKPRRRGALMVLAGLLAASGAIRIGLGVQEARALAPAEPPAPQAAQVCGPRPRRWHRRYRRARNGCRCRRPRWPTGSPRSTLPNRR